MIEYLSLHKPHIEHWLALSAILFSIGLYGLLSRRNAVGILMAIELMLNSAVLNLAAFNKFVAPAAVDGQIMGLFVIAVAAAEAVVAMAIFVAIFRYRRIVDVNRMDLMKY